LKTLLSKKRKNIIIVIGFLLLYILVFALLNTSWKVEDKNKITDVARLMPTKIKKMVEGKEEEILINTVKEANEKDMKISVAGKRHSQGGHTYYPDGIVLDMTEFNKVLDVDTENKTVHVQSGATWDDIQQAINPYGLSIKVMQSQNIFTIGGSLSVNVHGRDIRHGSLIETVNWFRLLKPNGEIIKVSRAENKEYFPLVIGGYGLFGVILDVELQLTDDELYELHTRQLSYKNYEKYFINEVKKDENAKMHLARISTAPGSFLTEMYVTDYIKADDEKDYKKYSELKDDRGTFLTKPLLGLSRDFDWGKDLFWNLQNTYYDKTDGKMVTRNNVMRSESEFLEYESKNDTDILQEYFVPTDEFSAYVDDLRNYLKDKDLNLINITIRYIDKNEEAVLSFAKEDMFAFVLLINQGLSERDKQKAEKIISGMIDITLQHDGSYYLPYYHFPSKEQMRQAYPRTKEFFQKKRKLDSEERFMNLFYEEYGL
jgi:decaprenylphospho-beta-D-ribofuranose 2-oxidase